MQYRRHGRREEIGVTLPSALWLTVFFMIPTLIVLSVIFRPADPFGGVGSGWTLDTLRSLNNPNYPAIIWRTLWISVTATATCLLVAIPMGYFMARCSERAKGLLLLLVVIPFWTNFLIRIFAWKVMLHPEGIVKTALLKLHLVQPDTLLMYNEFAVLLVIVYTYLPFAILPIYAATEKFDFSLFEAALDLGCSRIGAFLRVLLPGISRGLMTAALVVFIPALGSYVIPDIMGGPTSEMIGNKIAQRVFIDRNLPHAAALSGLLSLVVMAPMIVVMFSKKSEQSPVKGDRPQRATAEGGR
ncbi:MAG TPA: spermidine/putrescine ABC transporter permease [Verrucomicrobia bacterium]|nr:spermidine/putrescine ABC transporter permease [Verrucomicrobiota bacterium]